MYSTHIATSIRDCFDSLGISSYTFNKEKGVFTYDFSPDSKIKCVHCEVIVGKDSFSTFTTLNLAVKEKYTDNVISYLNKINQYTSPVKFSFKKDTKEITCECVTICNSNLSRSIIEDGLFNSLVIIKKFGDVIHDVAMDNISG